MSQPRKPYLAMNQYYLIRYNAYKTWKVRLKEEWEHMSGKRPVHPSPNMDDLVSEKALNKKRCFDNVVIYDIDCRKFPVTGYVLKERFRDIWNLFGAIGEPVYHYEFVPGEPSQLTFEQAREEIVEHICSHRWAGQTGGTPDQFRKYQATKQNMAELIDGIAFYGKYPFR